MSASSLTSLSPALADVQLTVPDVPDQLLQLHFAAATASDSTIGSVQARGEGVVQLCADCGSEIVTSGDNSSDTPPNIPHTTPTGPHTTPSGIHAPLTGPLAPPTGPPARTSAFPLAAHSPVRCRVQSVATLSGGAAVGAAKPVLHVQLSVGDDGSGGGCLTDDQTQLLAATAGDTVAVLCHNRPAEVAQLFRLLQIDSATAHRPYRLVAASAAAGHTGETPLPAHLPVTGTLCGAFTHCVQLRHVPSRRLLAALADCTAAADQRRRLQQLSSRQGGEQYSRHVLAPRLQLLQLLQLFDSCRPPVQLLLQLLPPLPPRIYSLAGGASVDSGTPCRNTLSLVVGVLNEPAMPGLFSHWFNESTLHIQTPAAQAHPSLYTIDPSTAEVLLSSGGSANYAHQETNSDRYSEASQLCQVLDQLAICDNGVQLADLTAHSVYVRLYRRQTQVFRPPVDPLRPLLMLAAGTGLAPFLSFIESRASAAAAGGGGAGGDPPSPLDSPQEPRLGAAWLVLGCRHSLLASSLLIPALQSRRQLTRLHVALSHGPHSGATQTTAAAAAAEAVGHTPPPLQTEAQQREDGREETLCRVQHVLQRERHQLCRWLLSGAAVYVCGPPAMMSAVRAEVCNTLSHALQLSRASRLDSLQVSRDLLERYGELHQLIASAPDQLLADAVLRQMVKLGLYKCDVWC